MTDSPVTSVTVRSDFGQIPVLVTGPEGTNHACMPESHQHQHQCVQPTTGTLVTFTTCDHHLSSKRGCKCLALTMHCKAHTTLMGRLYFCHLLQDNSTLTMTAHTHHTVHFEWHVTRGTDHMLPSSLSSLFSPFLVASEKSTLSLPCI
jgi:hypothetical protein